MRTIAPAEPEQTSSDLPRRDKKRAVICAVLGHLASHIALLRSTPAARVLDLSIDRIDAEIRSTLSVQTEIALTGRYFAH